jgi:CheY-like chemotaxis protein
MPSTTHREFRDAILDGIARYLWVTAYAEWAVSPGEFIDVDDLPERAGPGEDWDEVAPLTPGPAFEAASALERAIGESNGAATSRVLADLFGIAMTVDRGRPYHFDDADDEVASEFGASLAAMALGDGVSWFDDHKSREGLFDRKTLAIPQFMMNYDGSELSWTCAPCSGAAPWHDDAELEDDDEVKDEDDEDDEGPPPPPPKRGGHLKLVNPAVSNILVIEDDQTLQVTMRRMLRRLYPAGTVEVVDNAKDAIDHIDAHPPDLILSDYDIVGSTGGDVLAYIQHAQPQLVNRFIFITGNDIVERLHPYRVKKPVTMKQVAEAIESLPHDNPATWPRSQVQSLLFDKGTWTAPRAKAWARKHGFAYGQVDTTEHKYRLRQFAPTGAPCRTIQFGHEIGIHAVVCRGR